MNDGHLQQRRRGVRGGAALGPALWAAAKARVLLWDRLAKDPKALEAVQTRMLVACCRAALGTEFGWKHGLSRVRDHAELAARVPLRSYAELEPLLLRMRGGETDVLAKGQVEYFARTAGSTAKKTKLKYLPISRTQIAWQQGQAFDVLARYLDLSGDRALTSGYALALLEPPIVDRDGRVAITSNPGLMQIHAPRFSRHLSLPSAEIHAITDYDAKLRAMADAYLHHDVRAVAGTTCWMTMLFDRVLERSGAKTIHEVWPNLRALFGGGVNAAVYRDVIDAKVGGRTWLMDTYNATEGGVFAVTDRSREREENAMLVIPDRGVFFEFVTRDRSRTRLPLWKVEPGVDYSVALTTSSGLFGYEIGDVVRFASVFPHRLVFRGRVDGELSIAQEMTSAGQIEEAVLSATTKHACTTTEFAAAIEIDAEGSALGRYVLFVELERAPSDLEAFAADVDRELANENWLYGRYRTLGGFRPLVVHALERGVMRRFAEASGRGGLQQKFPRILSEAERDYLANAMREPATMKPGPPLPSLGAANSFPRCVNTT